MNRKFCLLLGSMLFLSFVADAAIIRGTGAGSATSSEAQTYYLIADEYVDALGVKRADSAADRETLIQGQIPLFAIPMDCYVDITMMPPDFVNDPCYYQFYQNERLQFEGYMRMYFEHASLMELVWTLSGEGIHQTFAGTHLDRTTLLDTAMPALVAGTYKVGLQVTFYAATGYKFYLDPSVHSENLNCGELIPGDQSSYSCSYGWAASESVSFSAPLEKMVILAGDRPITEQVPAPSSVLLLLLGSGLLFWRSRK